MKNRIKKIVCCLVVLFSVSLPAHAGWLDTLADIKLVDGNGQMQKQLRPASGFNEIDLLLPVRIELHQADSEKVEVDADENLQALIEVAVENGALQIRPLQKRTYPQMKNVAIKVYFKNLAELRISGAGKVSAPYVNTPGLHLRIGGSGDLQIQELHTEVLEVHIGGSGNFSAAGSATQIDATIGGSGGLLMDKLAANDVKVKIGGSGRVRTWAKNTLDVKIGGSGEVRYLGNPQIRQTIGGTGKIVQIAHE